MSTHHLLILGGQGDSVSILIIPRIHIVILVISSSNLLAESPSLTLQLTLIMNHF